MCFLTNICVMDSLDGVTFCYKNLGFILMFSL